MKKENVDKWNWHQFISWIHIDAFITIYFGFPFCKCKIQCSKVNCTKFQMKSTEMKIKWNVKIEEKNKNRKRERENLKTERLWRTYTRTHNTQSTLFKSRLGTVFYLYTFCIFIVDDLLLFSSFIQCFVFFFHCFSLFFCMIVLLLLFLYVFCACVFFFFIRMSVYVWIILNKYNIFLTAAN